MPASQRGTLFIELWETINVDYVYTDFRGLNWEQVYEDLLPRATSAESTLEFYTVMSEMVAMLDDDHSTYYPPWQVDEFALVTLRPEGFGGLGIMGYAEAQSFIVQYVFEHSSAERAGIMRRDRITHVNGQKLTGLESGGIDGLQSTSVRLTVVSPGQAPRDITLNHGMVVNHIFPSSRRLEADPSIVHLVVPTLFEEHMGRSVTRELEEESYQDPPISGLILDLRGNSGGWGNVLTEILGHFLTGNVGEMSNIWERSPLFVGKGALYEKLYSIPVVVLVDGGTESHAENMAAILQSRGKAKVIGTRSAGNTELLTGYDLSDGSYLWLAHWSFTLLDGTNLEGRGVIPDVPVKIDPSNVAEYEEAYISYSIDLIHRMKEERK